MHLVEQDTAFNNDLFELKELTKDGKGEQDLKESAWNKVQKFLYVLHALRFQENNHIQREGNR